MPVHTRRAGGINTNVAETRSQIWRALRVAAHTHPMPVKLKLLCKVGAVAGPARTYIRCDLVKRFG